MTRAHDDRDPDDAALVAYLDGELTPVERARIARQIASDHNLQRRLILLSSGGRPFRATFQVLLDQAPRARLEAMLAGLPGQSLPSQQAVHPVPRWSGMRVLVAGLFLFLMGFGSGWFLPSSIRSLREQTPAEVELDEGASHDDSWRQVVSEYLSLYSTETLASIPDNSAVREQELSSVGVKMGLSLSPQKIELPDLSLKRAQLLQHGGRRLGQIVYFDPESGPVALCFVVSDAPDTKLQTERREDFNVVHWSRGRYSFMFIGRAPAPRLHKFASDLIERLI